MQECFNIQNSINVVHQINKLKKKTRIINKCRENNFKDSISIHDENSQLTKGILFNLIKRIYKKILIVNMYLMVNDNVFLLRSRTREGL